MRHSTGRQWRAMREAAAERIARLAATMDDVPPQWRDRPWEWHALQEEAAQRPRQRTLWEEAAQ
jgi:hypothetical protein